ncbi:MAG: hypothetical protein AAGL24_25345 [Pseudomonadota bacterium]
MEIIRWGARAGIIVLFVFLAYVASEPPFEGYVDYVQLLKIVSVPFLITEFFGWLISGALATAEANREKAKRRSLLLSPNDPQLPADGHGVDTSHLYRPNT